jgi:hypothetical protein
MAAGAGESQEVERLLSYADDLLGVFRVSTDRDDNAQVGAGARRLVSACRSESDDLELQIKGPLISLCFDVFGVSPPFWFRFGGFQPISLLISVIYLG